MYEIRSEYAGSMNYRITSDGYQIKATLPKEGKPADGITPPALLLASLGSCMSLYLERYLTGGKMKFDTFSISVRSEISKEPPAHLKDIDVKVEILGLELDDRRKRAIVNFLRNCPVHNTLVNKPAIKIQV